MRQTAAGSRIGYEELPNDHGPDYPFVRHAHLPEKKRQELAHILRVVFEEFDDWQRGKPEEKRAGKILKVILFGSYARGDWVEDLESGYRSDYDLLAVVNIHSAAEEEGGE